MGLEIYVGKTIETKVKPTKWLFPRPKCREEEPGLDGDCLEVVGIAGECLEDVGVVYLEEEDGGESLSRRRFRGEVLVCCAGSRRRACDA